MTSPHTRDPIGRLVSAYERMLERIHATVEKAEHETLPHLKHNIELAREKAIELGELTREEADKIASYLERDMRDAASFLVENREAFSEWLRFDLKLIEDRWLEMFTNVADRTRIELEALAEQARQASLYHTGEITGPGTLICSNCGNTLSFHKTEPIPPCPKCQGEEYRRGDDTSEDKNDPDLGAP